ncbi:MAG TPA: N-acetyltransferase [Steroidobacter sp.]
MDLRSLTEADAEAFQRLRLEGLRDAPEAFAADFEVSAALSLDQFAATLRAVDGNVVIGAFAGRDLVGIGGFYCNREIKLRHKGTIWGVYITPAYRGRGVARRLIERLVEHAAGDPQIQQINITVTAVNARARQLYVGMGFETWGLERRALLIAGRHYDDEHMVLFLPGRGERE